MKYKILTIIFLGILFTTLIYFYTDKDNLNYLALGDGLSTGMTSYHVEGYNYNDYMIEYLNENNQLEEYYKNFNEIDETASSLVNKINNNIENIDQNIKIKQAIKEADIITIALGMDELNNYAKKNNLGSTKINGFIKKYEQVLKQIRRLNDKKVYVLGLYETSNIKKSKISKINEEIKNLCSKYKAIFIDLSSITEYKEFFANKKDYYLTYKGQEYIFNLIRNELEKPVFHETII